MMEENEDEDVDRDGKELELREDREELSIRTELKLCR